MKDKSTQDKLAADRQVELLVNAFEQAKQNGGVWLNADSKHAPMLHRKEVGVSAFNGMILGLHADAHNYQTKLYTFFSDAKALNSPIREHEQGVPFNWYKWDTYVNKNNPDDKISKEDYKALSPEEQKQYNGVRQRETRFLFNIEQTIMPLANEKQFKNLVSKYGAHEINEEDNTASRIAVNDLPSASLAGTRQLERVPLRSLVQDFQLKMRDNLVDVRHDGAGVSFYDARKNVIHLANENQFETYTDYANEVMRLVASATGHQQRMAREGMVPQGGQAPSEDAVRQEKLIQELTAGVKMQDLGMPAKLSKDGLAMVDYWTRELKENPCLIDIVERDVNNAIDVIRKAERGEKVELASKVNVSQTESLLVMGNKHFHIADEIKKHPNQDTKMMVVVKDAAAKTADVVLPSGASLERNNEVPGMSKERITKALTQQGFDTVRFYNPDGALGFRPDDSYFAGKEVEISKLKQWNLESVEQLDIESLLKLDTTDAVARASDMEFDRIQMVQDDDKRWALFVKPENAPSFTVYPDKADINRFFTVLKQSQGIIDDVRVELANKYYAITEAKPELKVDLFGKGQNAELDLNRIQKVSLFKTKDSVIMCAPTIEGVDHIDPRVVTPQQWQRFWLADDRQEYKKNLVATLFADVLQQTRSTEVVKENNDKVEAKQKEEQQLSREEQAKRDMEKRWNNRMKTWEDLKEKHPNARLMFRVGDFYELYKQDAIRSAEVLGLTLDKHNGVDMVAFPHFSLDTYLPKLIRAGERIAICDEAVLGRETAKAKQDEKPQEEQSQSKGVRR